MKSQLSLFTLLGVAAAAATPGGKTPACRFALDWSEEELLADPDGFASDMLYWEGKFHQDAIAFNAENGMSYDGAQIDWETGLSIITKPFSAASKEVRPHPPLVLLARPI